MLYVARPRLLKISKLIKMPPFPVMTLSSFWMFILTLLTLFVLDDVLVLLVHDGASEAVLGPGKES